MSDRAWLAFVAIIFILGGVFGWSARLATTSDRYLNTQADFIITNNTLERNQRNGSKKEN